MSLIILWQATYCPWVLTKYIILIFKSLGNSRQSFNQLLFSYKTMPKIFKDNNLLK